MRLEEDHSAWPLGMQALVSEHLWSVPQGGEWTGHAMEQGENLQTASGISFRR